MKKETRTPGKADFRTKLLVQFKDHIRIPYNRTVSKSIRDLNVGPWDQLTRKIPGLTIEPLITSVTEKRLRELISKAKEMDPAYKEGNLFGFFTVTCPVDTRPETVIEELSSWANIKDVKPLRNFSHPALNYTNEPLIASQGYLEDAPDGIGIKNVWGRTTPVSISETTGSDGFGIRLIDIEKRWQLDHIDLPVDDTATTGIDESVNCLYGTIDATAIDDGTKVLGIIKAVDNTTDCIGIAPAANVDVISYSGDTLVNAIIKSLDFLTFGDVLLIEAQDEAVYGVTCKVPVEINADVFGAIRLATALGIVVVEPGGNGDDADTFVDFDDFQISGQSILNPDSPQYHGDSGAIIVTASASPVVNAESQQAHNLMSWAPRGKRVDCYAWGENITTLSADDPSGFTETYSGTSGAAAIIAGTILSMQGMILANLGMRYSPFQIRTILRNPLYGTPLSIDPGTGTSFLWVPPVYMPDLAKFKADYLGLAPDIYMRDHYGDNGDPHRGAISCSPDVILKNSPLSGQTPQEAFGDGSEVLNDEAILYSGSTAVYYNYLYTRIFNRGGKDAPNAYVKLYYSVPATLLTPALLTPVELRDPNSPHDPISPNQFSFPGTVQCNDLCNVSNEYAWVAPQIGTATHYCFVGLSGNDEDPAPELSWLNSLTWDQYYKFIQNNNNVTWRNFNMVVLPPPAPMPVPPDPDPEPTPQPDPEPGQSTGGDLPKKGWVHIDFISPGLPGKNKRMDLEILSKLPGKSLTMLQAPLSWKKEVFRGSPFIRTNVKRKKCYSLFNPALRTRIENIPFKADSRTPLRLFLYIPDKLRNKKYTIAVRQMLDGKEIGRVSYELVPWKKKVTDEKSKIQRKTRKRKR